MLNEFGWCGNLAKRNRNSATERWFGYRIQQVSFVFVSKNVFVDWVPKLITKLLFRYCRKRTIAIECMKNFTVSIEPCLNEQEVASKTTFVNIFTNLLNFVCHKDGDQIALFIAEKGPECFNSKKDALIHCINTTMSGYIPSETPSLNSLPQLVMGVQQCRWVFRLDYSIRISNH